jgi:hypothetical protein
MRAREVGGRTVFVFHGRRGLPATPPIFNALIAAIALGFAAAVPWLWWKDGRTAEITCQRLAGTAGACVVVEEAPFASPTRTVVPMGDVTGVELRGCARVLVTRRGDFALDHDGDLCTSRKWDVAQMQAFFADPTKIGLERRSDGPGRGRPVIFAFVVLLLGVALAWPARVTIGVDERAITWRSIDWLRPPRRIVAPRAAGVSVTVTRVTDADVSVRLEGGGHAIHRTLEIRASGEEVDAWNRALRDKIGAA